MGKELRLTINRLKKSHIWLISEIVNIDYYLLEKTCYYFHLNFKN